MVVDLCLGGHWEERLPMPSSVPQNSSAMPAFPETHACKSTMRLSRGVHALKTGGVLQVGGLVHPVLSHRQSRTTKVPHFRHFRGCLRNLRINGEVSY